MLNDSLINAAQKLLKKQFPTVSGLQDVGLGSWMSFQYQGGELLKLFTQLKTIGSPSLLSAYRSKLASRCSIVPMFVCQQWQRPVVTTKSN